METADCLLLELKSKINRINLLSLDFNTFMKTRVLTNYKQNWNKLKWTLYIGDVSINLLNSSSIVEKYLNLMPNYSLISIN